MGQPDRKVSRWPILIGTAIGAVIGLGKGNFVVSGLLGLAIGYLIYALNRASAVNGQLHQKVAGLFERVALLEASVHQLRSGVSGPVAQTRDDVVGSLDLLPLEDKGAEEQSSAPVGQAPVMQTPIAADFGAAQSPAEPIQASRPAVATAAAPSEPSPVEVAVNAAKAWLFGGNTVARVGLLVLFIGVAFLFRYVAEHTDVPIEMRLIGVAIGALALLVFGWRLRETRPGYAITLQGGAIGILYLTVFAAMRLYGVVQPLPAFALLAALAVFSGVLAVAQDARALATLGAAGGFAAPILVSTGTGRIELLLSYYLLLNFGVLGIAWFRAWRELNWIGFLLTFSVMGAWVVQRYSADQYLLAQGFLVAFWLLFLVVAVLYALRQPQQTRGLFDTTLMFALPLAAFGIQSRLTDGVQLAIAATIAAAVYLFCSTVLFKRGEAALRVLVEASFGVGVAFLTLAVPLAASAQWTAAAWALEGLALLWVGVRQGRILPVAAGLLLHIGAAVALLRAIEAGTVSTAPQLSGFTLNLVVFAATAFLGSMLLVRAGAKESLRGRFTELTANAPWALRLLGWAWISVLVWQPLNFPWYVVGWCALSVALLAFNRGRTDGKLVPEWVAGVALVIIAWLATEHRANGLDDVSNTTTLLRLAVTVTAVTAAWLSLAGGRLQQIGAAALLTFGVVVWLIALFAETWDRIDDPFAAAQIALAIVGATAIMLTWLARRLRWSWPLQLSWVYFVAHIALAGAAIVMAIDAAQTPSRHFGWIVWPLAWLFFYARLLWEDRVALRAPLPAVLHIAGLWLLTAMVAAELALRVDAITADGWFFAAWGAVPAVSLWLVIQFAVRWPMRAAPSAYANIGAPGLGGFALAWIVAASIYSPGDPSPIPYMPLLNPLDLASLLVLAAALRWHLADRRVNWQRPVRVAIGFTAFAVINAAALRAVHFLAGVPWTAQAMTHSLLVQAVLSLLWTLTAMGLMVFANRRAMRGLWLIGAALLAAVVLKLFLVDLSAQGTIERIVSFVGVGMLILLIGYLAPVPPGAAAPEKGTA